MLCYMYFIYVMLHVFHVIVIYFMLLFLLSYNMYNICIYRLYDVLHCNLRLTMVFEYCDQVSINMAAHYWTCDWPKKCICPFIVVCLMLTICMV